MCSSLFEYKKKKERKKSKQIKTPLNTHFLCIYQVFKPKITIRGTKCFIYKTPSLKLELYFLPPTLHKYLYLQSNHHTKGVRWFEKHFHITDCFYYFIIIIIFCLFCFVLFFVCLFVCLFGFFSKSLCQLRRDIKKSRSFFVFWIRIQFILKDLPVATCLY